MPRAPRGTNDILPSQQRYWKSVETAAESICETFGFDRIRLPAFEDSSLFIRGIGDTTDVVEKEMYTFLDRGGDSLTLLPEGTASVCRAYIQHGMHTMVQPVRLYYFSPIFRYERPQSGRYRQHHQFGVEALGSNDPIVDAEIIELGWSFLKRLGLHDSKLLVNSIGCPTCRLPYGKILKEYYVSKLDSMCQDCNSRYDRAPLRVVNCVPRWSFTYSKEQFYDASLSAVDSSAGRDIRDRNSPGCSTNPQKQHRQDSPQENCSNKEQENSCSQPEWAFRS